MINVYNATLEDRMIQFNSTSYMFKARGLCKFPEDLMFAINSDEYRKFGFVVVNSGDDLKSKEREALINYLGFLNERISFFNMYLDEKKRSGVTIEAPRDLQKYKQWREEIIARLEIDGELEPIPSFTKIDSVKSLFDGEMKSESVEEIVKRGPGRPAKSFKEVDINKEIKS